MKDVTPNGRRLGRKPDQADPRDRRYAAVHRAPRIIPPQVDLEPRLPPAFDQGQTSSCGPNSASAFMCALTGVMEPYSRLQIYYGVRALEGDLHEDGGVETRDLFRVLQLTGAAPEKMWPFDKKRMFIEPPDDVYGAAEKTTIDNYSRLDTADDYLACLADGFPFVLGFTVFETLDSDTVARTGVVPMPTPGEKNLGGHDVLCLHSKTTIPLLDGTSPTIEELAGRSEPFWLYSCDENQKVVPGLGHYARLTGHKKVIGVELDNGEIIYCTPDHKFMMRSGQYQEAGSLVSGSSLMTLYRKYSMAEMASHEMVLHPQSEKQQYPHRVVQIFDAGMADVYDLTVEFLHNFAVGAGIFVHNCVGYDTDFHRNPAFLKSGVSPSRVCKTALKIRNSWGAEWGLKGHFFLPIDYADDDINGGDAWSGRLATVETV